MAHNTFNARQVIQPTEYGTNQDWVVLENEQSIGITDTIDASEWSKITFRLTEIESVGGSAGQMSGSVFFFADEADGYRVPFKIHQFTLVPGTVQKITYYSFDLARDVQSNMIVVYMAAPTNGSLTIEYLFGL